MGNKKTNHKEDAEDLTNSVFLAIFEYFNKNIQIKKLENLICKIAYNLWCTKAKNYIKEKIIVNCFRMDEFFINKAIGWALREYSKTNPKWVRDFIDKYNDEMNSLSIKEASKYIFN